jgi:predicted DNA-binding transcriptional regulator YafY
MPVNRNALIRYKTIDKCLQNRRRKWTLEDLIDKVSDALYEYEGIDKIISKRTIQADIQMMRSDKLGYNAPIIVTDKKYYSYDDATYSITNIPLSENDMNTLTDIVQVLKQFKGFQHFNELTEVISKLEDKVYSQKHHKKSVIDFEKNENLKGIHFLDELYHAIIHEKVLDIHYQSFTASRSTSLEFHPWLLKEFRNRWFIIGKPSKSNSIFTLALDRIISISYSKKKYTK